MNKYDTKLKDIQPKDLLFVILYGGVISVGLGFAIGIADYYLSNTIGFSFAILFFLFSSQFIGNMVRKQYQNPHVVYTVITGIFLVVQAIIIYGLPAIMYSVAIPSENIALVFDIRLYGSFLLAFFRILFTSFDIQYLFMILVVFVGTYVGIRKTY